jgi:hypothetical protein
LPVIWAGAGGRDGTAQPANSRAAKAGTSVRSFTGKIGEEAMGFGG